MDSIGRSVHTYTKSVTKEVQKNFDLPSVLTGVVAGYADYSAAFRKLSFDNHGIPIDSEVNKEILDALGAAVADPDCPREVSEFIGKQYGRDELRQLLGVEKIKSDSNVLDIEIQKETGLSPDISEIIMQFSNYAAALQPFERDQAGRIIQCEKNQTIYETSSAALSDPDCEREVINTICANFKRNEFNELIKNKLGNEEAVNLDKTKLGYPDFSGITLTERFSAADADFYRPDFSDGTINGNLKNLEVFEPFCQRIVVAEGAQLDGSNLLTMRLGTY
ncbi:hypothetical protein AAKU67_001330 [Oxalobacteraceae bacterium GrIS 2.11]